MMTLSLCLGFSFSSFMTEDIAEEMVFLEVLAGVLGKLSNFESKE